MKNLQNSPYKRFNRAYVYSLDLERGMGMQPPTIEQVAGALTERGLFPQVLGVYVTEQAGAWETFALLADAVSGETVTVDNWPVVPVSVQSPIGQRLQSALLAEELRIAAPGGEFAIEIVSINGCPLVSPQERLRLRKLRETEKQLALAARWAAEQEAHQRRLQQRQEQTTLSELKQRRLEKAAQWRQEVGR